MDKSECITTRRKSSLKFHIGHFMSRRFTSQQCIERGEPYFISGRMKDKACIIALGSVSFWKKTSGPFVIIGEAIDPKNKDDMEDVLEARRNLNIWGCWYSKYCEEGEMGYIGLDQLDKISEKEFYSTLRTIVNAKNSQ